MTEMTCAKCSKKLRQDNTKGICGDASACAKRANSGEAPAAPTKKVPKTKRAPTSADAGWGFTERFKVVATALGYDADELLEEFCEGWLANLKEAADEATDDDA